MPWTPPPAIFTATDLPQALAKSKKVEDGALDDEAADIEADDEALEDTEDLAEDAAEIEVEVEDDKGEGDR